MTQQENLLRLLRREGFEWIPPQFYLCPSLEQEFHQRTGYAGDYEDYYGFAWRNISNLQPVSHSPEPYAAYHALEKMNEGTYIDTWGVAHEPTPSSMHMTKMYCPLCNAESLEELQAYPYPDFVHAQQPPRQKQEVEALHAKGLAAVGNMQCTIWETAWYLRGMEPLMMDMMCDDEMAEYLLDRVTMENTARAQAFARAGVDILYLGDDIGMQKSIMMSEELYCKWLKPRLRGLIAAAKQIKPDLIVVYHSCGFVTPFIPHLIEAGVDVLNPIQSECMDFTEIVKEYGSRISFHGTIGTQTTMPFGTPKEVYETTQRNLDICGNRGGLLVAPTHLLEPEVPFENIEAYVQACRDYTKRG